MPEFMLITQVPLAVGSLNKGDVFILDAGEKIMLWMPPESGRMERIKVCNEFKCQHETLSSLRAFNWRSIYAIIATLVVVTS